MPLEHGRAYDKPAGAHVGHGASLRVPVSTGPSDLVLDRGEHSLDDLIAAEPTVDPLRAMELGTDYDTETRRRLHELDVPIRAPHRL